MTTPEAAIAALRAAVRRFKAWAEQFPTKQNTGEWECDYEHWPEIESAFESCLDVCPLQHWTDELVELMLYAIATS